MISPINNYTTKFTANYQKNTQSKKQNGNFFQKNKEVLIAATGVIGIIGLLELLGDKITDRWAGKKCKLKPDINNVELEPVVIPTADEIMNETKNQVKKVVKKATKAK